VWAYYKRAFACHGSGARHAGRLRSRSETEPLTGRF
jgi:hypothetical protein